MTAEDEYINVVGLKFVLTTGIEKFEHSQFDLLMSRARRGQIPRGIEG